MNKRNLLACCNYIKSAHTLTCSNLVLPTCPRLSSNKMCEHAIPKQGPAGANQDNQGKKHNSLQKTENIKQNIPSMGFFSSLNERLVLFLPEDI